VKEVMLTDEHIPTVQLGSKVGQAIEEINAKKIGATLVTGNDQRLEGIISDGDLRRALINKKNIPEMKVEEIMSFSPKTIHQDETSAEALGLMELHAITHLVVVDEERRVKGVVHLHDLLGREGFIANAATNSATRAHR